MAGLEPATSCFLHLPLKGRALPTELHDVPYHYHAQRIFCAIMLNNVAYQAATDGRAFQLTPLSLVSLVRSSTARLLVACATGINTTQSSQPASLLCVAAGIHRPHCQSWLSPTCQRTISFHFVEGVGLEPHELLREQIYSLSHLPLCQPSNILCLCCVVVIVKNRRISRQAGADEKISINLVHVQFSMPLHRK